MSDKPEIDVQRRRKGEKPTRQVERPVRRESSRPSKPSGGLTGGGFPGGSSGGVPGGSLLRSSSGKMGCGGILLVGLFVILYVVFGGGLGDLQGEQPVTGPSDYEAPAVAAPSRTPWPTSDAPPSGDGDTWLVMVYQDADDQALEQDIFIDLNEMERIGSTENVQIVSQIDRFRGGFSGDGNWHSTRRYLVLYDDDLNTLGSELVDEVGEVNMADGESLVDFVTWAVREYPADKHVLIMSDHGMGWPGGWSDPAPGGMDSGSAPIIRQLGHDSIFLSELDDALAQIQANTGIDKFELIGMDACLMSQLEIYSALQPYARYAVASEETEPGLGWAYAAFLSLLVYDPTIETAQLATNIVDTYIDQDERIVDDQARYEFLQQNGSTGGFFGVSRVSAAQLAGQLEQNITLTAVDLTALPALNERFNAFSYAMQSIDQREVAMARSYAQSYTSIFGRNVPASYIDLGHFVQLVVKYSNDAAIRDAADAVLDALDDVVIAERHGRSKPGSTGIAIYFPNSSLYKNPATGIQSYAQIAERFTRVSLWDDFMGFHYANRNFESDAFETVSPSTSSITRAPGGSEITISGIEASSQSVSPGEFIELSAEITGENIGYVYLFTGLYDPDSNSILVADTDYLESPDTQSQNGVYYPVWPDADSFQMNFDWDPVLFTITDGTQSAIALFNPVTYGASAEDALYAVEGTYTFRQTGESRKAEMLFNDGKLFQVFGYNGSETAGAPTEITPTAGDSFTIWYKWMGLDSSGNVTDVVYEDGDTLVFGSSPFEWEQVYAPDGDYLVGFLVSDLDGNMTQAFLQVKVQ
ncbi:MAG: clostripain-related cysteine peptidase [Brevefilum sp.]|nr:clostripain-related cysteine peptidase [Brevefilum sp.]MDT8381312.1 clostripain-related cysteine peptidase [Brevefilum sp.]